MKKRSSSALTSCVARRATLNWLHVCVQCAVVLTREQKDVRNAEIRAIVASRAKSLTGIHINKLVLMSGLNDQVTINR